VEHINNVDARIINILEQIISDSFQRESLIEDFQNKIWNEEFIASAEVAEIYRDLANDLNYYEPTIEWRKEDPSYYGEDRLIQGLLSAISKIKKPHERLNVPRET
jgi:hypothetical protein